MHRKHTETEFNIEYENCRKKNLKVKFYLTVFNVPMIIFWQTKKYSFGISKLKTENIITITKKYEKKSFLLNSASSNLKFYTFNVIILMTSNLKSNYKLNKTNLFESLST